MSTRAGIIIKDTHNEIHFYRHSDGYPKGTMPTLNIFLNWVKESKIRNNASQAAGWLVIIGAIEYNSLPTYKTTTEKRYDGTEYQDSDINTIELADKSYSTWKVGAYEPTTNVINHGDLEYIYTVDIDKHTITAHSVRNNYQTGSRTLTKVPQSELELVNP